jgi:hypothetical protein
MEPYVFCSIVLERLYAGLHQALRDVSRQQIITPFFRLCRHDDASIRASLAKGKPGSAFPVYVISSVRNRARDGWHRVNRGIVIASEADVKVSAV